MHKHFFLEERDETLISSKGKVPFKANVQFVRENTCIRVAAALMNIGVAKCNGCEFSECLVNKVK